MPLGEAKATAREAAALIPMVERSSQGGGNRPGPGPDLRQTSLLVMAHHHPAGVAGQPLGRLRGNARAVLEDRLARLLRIGQHLGIDVDHHLVALPRGTGIEAVVQGRLCEQGQGIGLLLGDRGRFRGNVPGACIEGYPLPGPLLQQTRAAARVCGSSAPTTGSRRPLMTTMPSSA